MRPVVRIGGSRSTAAARIRPPLANRVAPDGALEAVPERGLMMGNRGGRIHDDRQAVTGRPWASRQWICCLLAFKGRRRDVWGRFYTELFFCDEVTALAAGHRPCFECRRAEALSYRAAASAGPPLSAREIDVILDHERRDGRAKRLHAGEAAHLPDGAMVLLGGQAHAIRGDRALAWSHAGYGAAIARPRGPVDLLTPPLSLRALEHGFRPLWHPSAGDEQRSVARDTPTRYAASQTRRIP
jgi:hypothetical protein